MKNKKIFHSSSTVKEILDLSNEIHSRYLKRFQSKLSISLLISGSSKDKTLNYELISRYETSQQEEVNRVEELLNEILNEQNS